MKLFFLLITLSMYIYASQYPKTFAQLGTPLYKSLKPISQYKDVKILHESLSQYEESVTKAKAYGFKVDITQDKKTIKQYLFTLRKLQKEYDFLLHLLHKSINNAIDEKNYSLFLSLTNYEFEGLLRNSNLRIKALKFYKKNSKKKRSKILDKKIHRANLEEETTQEFFNQAKELVFDPKADNYTSSQSVSLLIGREKDKIFVDFKNKNPYDVTIKMIPRYENIVESEGTQKVLVVKAHETKRYSTLHLEGSGASYSFKYRWIIGNKDAVHNDKYLYRLPYAKGTSHRVSQGFNGKETHKGHSQYAVDFAMPEGTKIYAARSGKVIKTKSNSNKGGFKKEFAKYGNYVTIVHNDGTIATYYHLKKNGVIVNVGDSVQRGQPIGYSGNTGYTSGPHLHLAVFTATSKIKTKTVAIKFISKDGVDAEPRTGVSYTAK